MKKILIIIALLFSVNGCLFAKSINRDSVVDVHLNLFIQEASIRGIDIDQNIKITFQFFKLRRLGAYGRCIKKNGSITVAFDIEKFDRYVRKKNARKIKYLIYHELAHALINKHDNVSSERDIMNANIFNNSLISLINIFHSKYESEMVGLLFKLDI